MSFHAYTHPLRLLCITFGICPVCGHHPFNPAWNYIHSNKLTFPSWGVGGGAFGNNTLSCHYGDWASWPFLRQKYQVLWVFVLMGTEKLSALISVFVQLNVIDLYLMIWVTHKCVPETQSGKREKWGGRQVEERCVKERQFVTHNVIKSLVT